MPWMHLFSSNQIRQSRAGTLNKPLWAQQGEPPIFNGIKQLIYAQHVYGNLQ